jgi:hypothetical protein
LVVKMLTMVKFPERVKNFRVQTIFFLCVHTFDKRSGETYMLRVAETFFGDMSGRFGNRDSRGDSGN